MRGLGVEKLYPSSCVNVLRNGIIRFEFQAPSFLNLWLIPKREMHWEHSIPCRKRRKFVRMLDVITFEPSKELGGNFGIIMIGMCVECFHCAFMSPIPCSKFGNVNKLGCWQLQWPLRFAYCLPSNAACQHHMLNNFVVWGNWEVKSCTRVAVWMCYGMEWLDLKSKHLHFSTSDSFKHVQQRLFPTWYAPLIH